MIAILEKNITRVQAMRKVLEKASLDREAVFFNSAQAMIFWLKGNLDSVRFISLDSNLRQPRQGQIENAHPGTGMEVVNYLSTQPPCCMVMIHTSDTRAIAEMGIELTRSGWNNSVVHRPARNWLEKQWLPRIMEEVVSQILSDGVTIYGVNNQ